MSSRGPIEESPENLKIKKANLMKKQSRNQRKEVSELNNAGTEIQEA